MTCIKSGRLISLSDKIDVDHKRGGAFIHRYASVNIFDKYDYEKKLE